MKVRAVKMGYYKLMRRNPGDEFDVPEHLFSDANRMPNPGWMEKVDGSSKPKRSAKAEAKAVEVDDGDVI